MLIKGEATLPVVKDILTKAVPAYSKMSARDFTDDDAFMDSIQRPLECLQLAKVRVCLGIACHACI